MKKMSEKPAKKSTSILSRTVKNIKRNRKARNFIRIQKNEIAEKIKTQIKPQIQNRSGKREKKGVVYLAHIPPGFYERQMKNYFHQFGEVTNVRLERSKKTGRSKGYAFIEFQYAEVAKIAAETMNNYILFDRMLKAEYIPRKYPKKFWRKPFNSTNCPKSYATKRNTNGVNKLCTPGKEKARLRRRLNRLDDMIQKLKEKGINYSYKPAIRKEIADSPCTDGKYTPLETDTPVLEIDESDKEIEFMTPPNVVKKKLSNSTKVNGKSHKLGKGSKKQKVKEEK